MSFAEARAPARAGNSIEIAKPITVALRFDGTANPADSPWNTEQTSIKPGETGTIKVIFGYAYGGKQGYPLTGESIGNLKLFVFKSKDVQTFRIDSIVAAGEKGEKPPVNPNAIRVKPKDGQLLDPKNVVDATHAQAAVKSEGVKIVFEAGQKDRFAKIKPALGRWDLRDGSQVRVKIKNIGDTPASIRASVNSNAGSTDSGMADNIAPGASAEIVLPFAASKPWLGIPNSGNKTSWDGVKDTGTKFHSNEASAVTIGASNAEVSLT